IAADLERNAKVPYPRDWLMRVQRALSDEIVKSSVVSPRHHSKIGFDYDYLMNNQTSIAAQLRREFDGDVSALCAFYWFYYRRVCWLLSLFLFMKSAPLLSSFFVSVSLD